METYQKQLQDIVKMEKDRLRVKDNLSLEDTTEIGELELAITSLEKTLNLRIPEMGMTMSIVDGPECDWNLEITRDTHWKNIREIFDRLGIKVHVFNDRVEIRGHIPTEIIDIPRGAGRPERGPIICSAGG